MAGASYGRRALNKFGEKGLKLPNVKGKIDVMDQELMIEDGALVIAANLDVRYVASTTCGMLMCGIRFEATAPTVCMSCRVIGDERHPRGWTNYWRSNCRKWQDVISVNDNPKRDPCMQKMWELHLGNGAM